MNETIPMVCEDVSWSRAKNDWVLCEKPRTHILEPDLKALCDEHYKIYMKYREKSAR